MSLPRQMIASSSLGAPLYSSMMHTIDAILPRRPIRSRSASRAGSGSWRRTARRGSGAITASTSVGRLGGLSAALPCWAASGKDVGGGLRPQDVLDPLVEDRGIVARLDARALLLRKREPGPRDQPQK